MRSGVLALLSVVLVAVPARAQQQQLPPPPRLALRLEYNRGLRIICPDEHAVAEILRGSVDYEEREDAELRAVVTTSRVGRRHRVEVVLRDRTGTALWSREHDHPDCTDALLSCAVSMALGLMNLKLPGPVPVAVAPAPAPVAPALPPAAPICVAPPVPVVPPPPAAPTAATQPPGDAGLSTRYTSDEARRCLTVNSASVPLWP